MCTTELSAVSLSAEEFAKRGVKVSISSAQGQAPYSWCLSTPFCNSGFSSVPFPEEYDDEGCLIPYLIYHSPQVIGLSANDVDSHHGWIKDIDEFSKGAAHVDFPIVADKSRKVSTLYGMLDHQDATNVDAKGIPFTVRSVFISMCELDSNSNSAVDPQQKIRLTLTYPAAVGRNFAEILRVIDALQLGDKYKITTPANWEPAAQTSDPARSRVIVHPSVQGEEVQKLFGDDVDVVYVSSLVVAEGATCTNSRSPTSASRPTPPPRPRLPTARTRCSRCSKRFLSLVWFLLLVS